ncbi:MAG: hypothetical protein OXR66_01155 [Candidatus Woesearchaeota archaeon]|nr:hypothetical protein [Candidatus Woesearchaeota archaeon]
MNKLLAYATVLLLVPLVLAMPRGTLEERQAFHDTVSLASNTYTCGDGIRCEAYINIPIRDRKAIARNKDIFFSLAYLNGTESNYTINYEVGHYEKKKERTYVQRCRTVQERNGSTGERCRNVPRTKQVRELVWHGQHFVPGMNVLHLWSDDKPADAIVDWNFRIPETPVQMRHKNTEKMFRTDFDTRVKGWAIWGDPDWEWQNSSFSKRRTFALDESGRTNTPVLVTIADLSTTGNGFAVYTEQDEQKPLTYLDAEEHITTPGNATHILFTADSGETYFLYYENTTAVPGTNAFLVWDRFTDSTNSLPWTERLGSWTYTTYANKAGIGHVTYDVANLYDYKDLGTFARVLYTTRGDGLRFAWRDSTTGNLGADGSRMVCDFGPSKYRCFGNGYADLRGNGGATNVWHDYTFRIGTSGLILYEDEGGPLITFTTPNDAQIGPATQNRVGMGGQESGAGRFDDYALWNWTLLGRVNFYDSLSTTYQLGAEQGGSSIDEEAARAAIYDGLNQSVLAGNYSASEDQDLVVRYQNGTIIEDTLDIFVANGMTRWAFDYTNTTATSIVNITPAFYVWTGMGMTASEIIDSVRTFVDGTA